MKKTGVRAIEKLFDDYLESYSDTWSALDREQQDTFNAYQESIRAGNADPEDLADVQYMALKAGFFAGFRTAGKLAVESISK